MHVHNYKTTDILFEQPTGAENTYIDIRVKKCRCGKEKKVLINFYFAKRVRIPFHSDPSISYLGLGNKISLI